jgi:hypothetical protein
MAPVASSLMHEQFHPSDSDVNPTPPVGAPADAPRAGPMGVPYRRYFWLLTGGWSAAVAGSLIWTLVQHAEEIRSDATAAARALLEKDLLYRDWSLRAGGVYVPDSTAAESDASPPSEERQIVIPSGQRLTLLNPALVSRQLFEIQRERSGIQGHLTSLRPLRPANLPDAWERQALQTFENGAHEASVIENRQGERYFRMMRPLVTTPNCLRCHEEQDRKVGEVRGGISLTVPLSRFATAGEKTRLTVAHLGLWLLGLAGLLLAAISLRRQLRARRQAETDRERLISELQQALANVKTLHGLIPICSSCKKIRNDEGDWTKLETYLRQHTNAEFSHALCVDCLRKLYPNVSGEVEARVTDQTPSTANDPTNAAS